MEDFDNILNPQPEPESSPEPEPTPEPQPEPEPAPTGADPAPSPGANEELENARKQADGLKAELDRQRRQNQELKRQQEQLLAQQQQPRPDFWEEPETVVDQKVSAVEQKFTERLLRMSVASVYSKHEDADEKIQAFDQMAAENPALWNAMLDAVDPGEFAYKTAAQAIAMREMGDPVSYRAKIEAEVRAQIAAEQEAKVKADTEAAIAARLKGGFSEQRSAMPRDPSGKFTGHRPMSDILGKKP